MTEKPYKHYKFVLDEGYVCARDKEEAMERVAEILYQSDGWMEDVIDDARLELRSTCPEDGECEYDDDYDTPVWCAYND